MLTTERAEKYRKKHPAHLVHKKGDLYGWFEIPTKNCGPILRCLVSQGFEAYEFDHVSVSLAHRCPTWEEMCMVKDIFFDEKDCVVQFHVPKSDHVNCMPYCLHLWRWTKGNFPRPNALEVGPL